MKENNRMQTKVSTKVRAQAQSTGVNTDKAFVLPRQPTKLLLTSAGAQLK